VLAVSPVALVVARMSSSRLPGKSLVTLGDDVVLGYVTNSLSQCDNISEVVVVTSTDPSDDPIAGWCKDRGLNASRGSLNNVAARVLGAAQEFGAQAFVRVSGDSPLIDPVLVDYAVGLYRGSELDLVTNVFPRTFPRGQSVEVVRTESLALACAGGLTVFEQEHVTQVYYLQSERFRIRNFTADQLESASSMLKFSSSVHLAIDEAQDLVRSERVIQALGSVRPWEAGWEACSQIALSLENRA